MPSAFTKDHAMGRLVWRLSNTMEVGFCLEALEEALSKGRPGNIQHRPEPTLSAAEGEASSPATPLPACCGSQEFASAWTGKGYNDNVFVERLWRSIKYEEVYLKAHQNGAEARAGMGAYLEFYNQEQPHQALGYRNPGEVFQEEQHRRGGWEQEVALPSRAETFLQLAVNSLNLASSLSNDEVHLFSRRPEACAISKFLNRDSPLGPGYAVTEPFSQGPSPPT